MHTLRSDNVLPFRDSNGLRRLLVLLTARGKLFAMHSGDGRLLWTSSAPAALAGSAPQRQLLPWRRFHDLTHAPQLLLLSPGQSDTAALVIDGHTGALIEEVTLPYQVDKVRTAAGSREGWGWMAVCLGVGAWMGRSGQREAQQNELHATEDSSRAAFAFPSAAGTLTSEVAAPHQACCCTHCCQSWLWSVWP